MVNFIYYYGMTSVICIMIYEFAVLKDAILKISTTSLILRFLFSLMFGPVLLTLWVIMVILSKICVAIVSNCKYTMDMNRAYIDSVRRKYDNNLDDISYDEMWIIMKMARETKAMNRRVKRCGRIVDKYSKLSILMYKNFI